MPRKKILPIGRYWGPYCKSYPVRNHRKYYYKCGSFVLKRKHIEHRSKLDSIVYLFIKPEKVSENNYKKPRIRICRHTITRKFTGRRYGYYKRRKLASIKMENEKNSEQTDTEDDITNSETTVPPPKSPRKRDDDNWTNPIIPDVSVTAPLRLEAINLPIFNGDLTEWATFSNLFTYLINNNSRLSDIVKFYQLRGPALDTIRRYQITATNYQAAWIDLQRRYDRTDNLIQEYIRRFLETPDIINRCALHIAIYC